MYVGLLKKNSTTSITYKFVKYLVEKKIISPKFYNEELKQTVEEIYYDKEIGAVRIVPDTIIMLTIFLPLFNIIYVLNKLTNNLIIELIVESPNEKFFFIGVGSIVLYGTSYLLLWKNKKYIRYLDQFDREEPKLKLKWNICSVIYLVIWPIISGLTIYYISKY